MSAIHNWIDGYIALKRRAEELRGSVELDHGTIDAARWPRTTGADVLAIAALLDPLLRCQCARHGGHGIERRWRAAVEDIARFALHAPRATYSENRSFWATAAAACVYLDSVATAIHEPGTWDALIDKLGDVVELRNAGPREDGPFAHFEGIKTFDDLWTAQRQYLAGKRSSDRLDPPSGFGGGVFVIPRTTNGDVLQLAAYWSDQLTKAKRVMGYDAVVTKWKVALADVDHFAKTGKPDDVYPKNNEFWRSAFNVAVQVAIGDESPSKWDMVVDSLKESVMHLPENLEHAASKGADLIASAAHAVGKVANEAGRGLFSGFGTPLLIGGGLLGLFLIAHSRHSDAHAE